MSMDIGLLADPTRCPDCAIALPGTPPECPACGLPLRGQLAEQLWRVSVAAAGMLEERATLIGHLRVSARVPAGGTAAGGGHWRTRAPGLPSDGGAWLPPPRAYDGGAPNDAAADLGVPDVVRDPARPRQVQRLLLGLGVLLLTVAAIIFTVVAWGRFGIGGRSLILAGITGAAAWASAGARRRELPGTAESLGALTTAFLLLDAYGARSADLFGLRSSAADVYWALVVAGIACLGAALWRAHPLHVVRHAAVLAAQLPLLLIGERLPEATFAALLCAQGAVAVALSRRLARPDSAVSASAVSASAVSASAVSASPGSASPAWGVRALAGLGGAAAYAGGLLYAAELAYDRTTPALLGAAVAALVFAALAAAWVARYVHAEAGLRLAASAAATAAALLAAHAPMYRNLELDTATAGGAALLLATFVLLTLTPAATAAWRSGPLTVVALGTAAALVAVAEDLAAVPSGAFGWLDAPWEGTGGRSAQQMLTVPWTGSGLVPVTLALLTAGAALATWRLRSGAAAAAAGALGTALVVALPVAADAPYLLTVLSYVALGGALLAAAGRVYAAAVTADTRVLTAVGLAVAGFAAAGLGVAWAMATPTATAWALVVALAAAAAAHAADPRVDRPAPVAAAALLLVGEACVLALLAGADAARTGFVGVVTASVLVVAAGRAPWKAARPHERLALETAGTCAAVLAFFATDESAIWGSNALLAAGTAAAFVALLPDRRPVAWLSGILVTASSWLRLAEAHVATPEAYTTGPAVALLIAGWWNRRGTPEGGTTRSSWAAYAPGLSMGLLPSLLVVLDEAGEPGPLPLDRPLLLGLGALVVLLVGVRARLQAPLLLGAGVLAVDAVILLAPYAAAVPRWVSIGAAGVLLLGLGATYEKRLRDVRRLREKLEALG